MLDGYGIIAVLTDYAPAVEEGLLDYTYEKEIFDGAVYFIVEEIDWSILNTTSGGLGGLLNGMPEDDYALAIMHGSNPSVIMHGNAERFGIKGIITYGNKRQPSTH